MAESPCYVLLSFSRNGTSWRQKSTIINKAISHCEREKHTICFNHGLPESPSWSMNARSAIINLSFHSLTFWGSFFQIDSQPLFSSNACEIEFNFYVERVCEEILVKRNTRSTFLWLFILVAALLSFSIELNRGRFMLLSDTCSFNSSALFCLRELDAFDLFTTEPYVWCS